MPQIITAILKILSFLATNKATITHLVTDIEGLIPDAPGDTKAAAVKSFIGTALGVEPQIEAAWAVIGPIFDALVASIKGTK